MKKAPKRYVSGGGVYDDPKKKKQSFTSSVPTKEQQFVDKGILNQSTANAIATQNYTHNIQDDNHKKANLGLQNAGTELNSGRTFLASDANGNTTYKDNTTGSTYTLDKAGNRLGLNKGGEVKKMTKAPRKNKGGMC